MGLPRVDFSLVKMPVMTDDGIEEADWSSLLETGAPEVQAVVSMRVVTAIVLSQDCDALRAPQITLCEVRPFRDVELKAKDTTAPQSWMRIIVQQSKQNLKWFYLPPDPTRGLHDKMAADFLVTISVLRADLENLRHRRIGRLNSVADEHFRERVAEFFRRYPVDEWYALDPDELQKYLEQYPGTRPFDWQST